MPGNYDVITAQHEEGYGQGTSERDALALLMKESIRKRAGGILTIGVQYEMW